MLMETNRMRRRRARIFWLVVVLASAAISGCCMQVKLGEADASADPKDAVHDAGDGGD